MAKKYTVLHYKDDCIGCGSCVAVSEEFWEMDDEGLAHLKGSQLQKGTKKTTYVLEIDDPGSNADAADICPAQVIEVVAQKKKSGMKKKKTA